METQLIYKTVKSRPLWLMLGYDPSGHLRMRENSRCGAKRSICKDGGHEASSVPCHTALATPLGFPSLSEAETAVPGWQSQLTPRCWLFSEHTRERLTNHTNLW